MGTIAQDEAAAHMVGVASQTVGNSFPADMHIVGDLIETAQNIKMDSNADATWTHLLSVPATTNLVLSLQLLAFAHVASTLSTQCCMVKVSVRVSHINLS